MRRVEDRLGRAVVLLEQNDLGVEKMLLEFQDIADIRLPETIDRLRIVADHANILLFFREIIDQRKLQRVGVLVFVDQDVFELLVIFVPDLPRNPQKPAPF